MSYTLLYHPAPQCAVVPKWFILTNSNTKQIVVYSVRSMLLLHCTSQCINHNVKMFHSIPCNMWKQPAASEHFIYCYKSGMWSTGGHLTTDVSIAIQIQLKVRFLVITFLISLQIFAHVTTARLFYNVQKKIAIGLTRLEREQNSICIQF